MLAPGQEIRPGLTLVRRLGQGGMGSVWVAKNDALDAEVAVKFVSEAYGRDAEAIARFQREARLAAKVKDPHIVQILDHGQMASGTPYIVMELCKGESLADRVEAGPLPPELVAEIVTQVAGTLAEAHQLEIVHRDIKPANLLLTSAAGKPFVKILDFGLAKQKNAADRVPKTAEGVAMGTLPFMSPEVLLATSTLDAKADLWALAVSAYQLLTGRLPFEGATIAILSMTICKGTFSLPSEVVPGLPAAIDEWFSRALAVDPATRFANPSEFAETFERACGGEARPVDAFARTEQDMQPYVPPGLAETRKKLDKQQLEEATAAAAMLETRPAEPIAAAVADSGSNGVKAKSGPTASAPQKVPSAPQKVASAPQKVASSRRAVSNPDVPPPTQRIARRRGWILLVIFVVVIASGSVAAIIALSNHDEEKPSKKMDITVVSAAPTGKSSGSAPPVTTTAPTQTNGGAQPVQPVPTEQKVAPAQTATAEPSTAPTTTTAPTAKGFCDPPYIINALGQQIRKPGCN